MARWRIEMLGGLRLVDLTGRHEPQTKFYSHKTALLLARLAFPPLRSYGREEMVELLWPESDPDAGRANLRNVLAQLRRQLEPGPDEAGQVLRADRAHLCLSSALIESDVAQFEQVARRAQRAGGDDEREEGLQTALALYGGELLPGMYADWVLRERERLALRHADVLRDVRALADRQQARQSQEVTHRSEPAPPPDLNVPVPAPFLPVSHTGFWGRVSELREVCGLLTDTPLVTLTGMGGIGKTRLAQEVGRAWMGEGRGRAAFVPLESVSGASLILPRALAVLGVSRRPDRDLLTEVCGALTENQITLLILDNYEQLRDTPGAGAILSDLTTRLPLLRLLVTSRAATGVAGEQVYRLLPLPIPRPSERGATLMQTPSVQMFVDRARRARPDFAVTDQNAPAVSALCAALEGIPLAIEIAGARALVATPQQMSVEMQKRLRFLASRAPELGGASGVGGQRHRSMRSALEWSHALLPPPLARFFASLAVFPGDFSLETARAVCGEDALDSLEDLCRASLLGSGEQNGQMRFRMLETVRAFAREKLAEQGNEDVTCRRHAEAFLAIADEAADELMGREQARWLDTLETEQDNLRASLAWFARSDDPLPGLQMGNALWRFWQTRGHLEEGAEHLRVALATCDARYGKEAEVGGETLLTLRGKVHNARGALLLHLNRFDEAQQEFGDALRFLAHSPADHIGPLNNLGLIHLYRGEYAPAIDAFSGCLAIVGPDGAALYRSSFLNNRGMAYLHSGAPAQAEADLREALRLYREVENPRGVAKALSNLGFVALARNEPDQAQASLRESLRLHYDLGDREACALCLEGLAACLLRTGAAPRGAGLFAAADRLRREIATPVRPVDEADHRKTQEALREAVGQESFDAIRAEQEEKYLETLKAEATALRQVG